MRLGADPELFIATKTVDPSEATGVFKSHFYKLTTVCGLLKADKHNPIPIKGLSNPGFKVQEDNVALEYNIPPSATKEEFVDNIQIGMKGALGSLPESSKYTHITDSAMNFPEELLEHPLAKVFGCEPDYNAWTGKVNVMPKTAKATKNLRTCGGHVHVETDLDKRRVIQAMDITLGVASVLRDINGGLRRKRYGNYGAYRPKPYGVEYRVLSNFWIFDKSNIEWVWDNTAYALELAADKSVDFEPFQDDVEKIINKGDTEAARLFCKIHGLSV